MSGKATKQQFDKRLTEIGYTLNHDDLTHDPAGYWVYSLYAPAGFMFPDTGAHSLCGSADTKPEMYGEILDRVGGAGLVPCDNDPCDGCADRNELEGTR